MDRFREILRMENVQEREEAYRTLQEEENRHSRTVEIDQTQQLINLTECLNISNTHVALQASTQFIPIYDGYNMPLKEFVQDIENAKTLITPAQQQLFLRTVISKIKGKARQTLEGYEFPNLKTLVEHLKVRFAPSKTYGCYINEILTSNMRQGESVREFHARLSAAVRGAEAAIKENLPRDQNNINQKPQLEILALEAFLRGLPEGWRSGVANAAPQSFQEALEIAVNLEKFHVSTNVNPVRIHYIPYTTSAPTPNNQPRYNQYPQAAGPNLYEQPHAPVYNNFNRTYYDSPYTAYAESPYQPERADTGYPPQNIVSRNQPRLADIHDPGEYNRHAMNYAYDQSDTYFPRTRIEGGNIKAPQQLSYNTGQSQQLRPGGILRRPENRSISPRRRQNSPYRGERSERLEYREQFKAHERPNYVEQHTQQITNRSRDPSPRPLQRVNNSYTAPPAMNESLNYQSVHRESATMNDSQAQRSSVRFAATPQSTLPEQ